MKKNSVSIKGLINNIYPRKSKLIPLALITILFASSKLLSALIYEHILNDYGDMNNEELLRFAVLSIVLIVVSTSGYYLFILWRRKIKQDILVHLQSKKLLYKRFQKLESWENEGCGNWMTYMTSDAEILANFVPNVLMMMLLGVTQFIFAIGYGFAKSWQLTLIILITTLFSVIIPSKIMPIIEKKRKSIQENDSVIKEFLIDVVSKGPLIKSFNATNLFIAKFSKKYDAYINSNLANTRINCKMNSLNIGLGFGANALWMSFGLYFISNGQLSLGGFIGFITLSAYFNYPFFQLSSNLGEYANVVSAYERFFSTIKQNTDETDNQYILELNNNLNSDFELTCKNISFKYKDNLKEDIDNAYIFNEISFLLEKGDKVLLKGKNGSGKSTFLKNVMSLYSVSCGEMKLEHCDENSEALKIIDCFSYVPQGNSLFSGSIKENILYGNSNISDTEIVEALKLSCSYDFVSNLTNGIDTIIGEGCDVQLSEGQCQRIAIARALVKKSKILCLDEITSALDSNTEQKILNNIKGRTYILISHNEGNQEFCNKYIEF